MAKAEKVFTVGNVKSNLHELINQYHGNSEDETAMIKEVINFTFAFPEMEDAVIAVVMEVFEHPRDGGFKYYIV